MENLKPINSQQKTWLTIGIGGVVVLVILYFGVYLNVIAIRETSAEISRLTNRVQNTEQTTSIQETLKTYNRYQQKSETLAAALLSQNRQLEFITSVEDVVDAHAVEHKINFGDLSPVSGGERVFYKSTIQLWLQGTFIDTLHAVAAIEQLPYYLNVKEVTINRSPREDSPDTVNIFIIADAYWQ